jgi:hypothetical protein
VQVRLDIPFCTDCIGIANNITTRLMCQLLHSHPHALVGFLIPLKRQQLPMHPPEDDECNK